MANLFDFLQWRGDLSFAQDPFHEVDNLVFCHLSYVDFESFNREITLKEAYDDIKREKIDKGIAAEQWSMHEAHRTLEIASHERRYRFLPLIHFVNVISVENRSQFSALTYLLPDDTLYIAYRGTDGSLVGWEENFLMSCQQSIHAQQMAEAYLAEMAQRYPLRDLRIGGHSKGGNLAVYAAMKQPPEIQDRIRNVYNNDGPGFLNEQIQNEGYERILPKVITYLPEDSVVGILLTSKGEKQVLQCSSKGVFQHLPQHWMVEKNRFLCAQGLSENSRILEHSIDDWLKNYSREDRLELVELVFGLLSKHVTNFMNSDIGMNEILSIVNSFVGLSNEKKNKLNGAVTGLFVQIWKNKYSETKKRLPQLPL